MGIPTTTFDFGAAEIRFERQEFAFTNKTVKHAHKQEHINKLIQIASENINHRKGSREVFKI